MYIKRILDQKLIKTVNLNLIHKGRLFRILNTLTIHKDRI
jgi:hypothetical protein